LKAQQAGVDAVVAEGFEAGGHNGREETTTMVLIPSVKEVLDIPLIAAGGIATGGAMLACFALGAEGVQVGSRFAVSYESSASLEFKTLCTTLNEGDTMLSLKKISPTRLVRNRLFEQIDNAEQAGASKEELAAYLGKGRARKGIFEGDINEGEIEIGQICSMVTKIETVEEIFRDLV
jgi:enoyl-[acyl-carrier protein] reductase II